jgi:hypothetical protein
MITHPRTAAYSVATPAPPAVDAHNQQLPAVLRWKNAAHDRIQFLSVGPHSCTAESQPRVRDGPAAADSGGTAGAATLREAPIAW